MRLFEGGILDKITNDEYEKMLQQQTAAVIQVVVQNDENVENQLSEVVNSEQYDKRELQAAVGKSSKEIDGNAKKKETSEKELTALSLQMLQGAFYLLLLGYLFALFTFMLEIGHFQMDTEIKIKFREITLFLRQKIQMLINRFIW